MKKILFICISLFIFASCSSTKELSPEDIAVLNKIDSRKYVFTANTALPSGFSSKTLSSGYTLSVSQDTVTAYLPYFGRAYVAPIGNQEGGIKFTSTKFEYSSSIKKHGREVYIKTKDTSPEIKLYLNISSSGNTILNVSDSNRQPISFSGRVD